MQHREDGAALAGHGGRHLGRRRCKGRAGGGERSGHGRVEVVHDEAAASLEQVARHRQTHVAEPDEADARETHACRTGVGCWREGEGGMGTGTRPARYHAFFLS